MTTFWTDRNFGIILMLVSGFGFAICNLLYDVVEGSLNSLAVIFYVVCFGRIITSLLHDVIIGLYNYYHVDQTNPNASVADYIIILSICNRDQMKGFAKLNNGTTFLCLAILFTGFIYIFDVTSLSLVNDIGDSSAIYRSDSILASIISYLIKHTRQDWKQRYWLCLLLVIIGAVLVSSPSFDTSTFDVSQFVGYLFAFLAALSGALDIVFSTLFKKVQVEYTESTEQDRTTVEPERDTTDTISDEHDLAANSVNTGEQSSLLRHRNNEQDVESIEMPELDVMGIDIDNGDLIALNDNKISIIIMYGGGISTGILCILIFGIAYGLGIESQFNLLDVGDMTTQDVCYLVSLVIINYIASYVMNLGYLKVNDASLSSILAAIAVVFTYIVAYIFVSEVPTYLSIIGAILVSTGVAVAVSPTKCSVISNF